MIKSFKAIALLITLLVSSVHVFGQDVLAFPTAEGYGRFASGGRGGKVVEVTSLEDKDRRGVAIVGGLRWALDQYPNDPLTVIFKVSGIIDLKGSDLRKKRNNLTIAGQTAPGDGICIKGGDLNLGGSNNLIVRHLRLRVGVLSSGGFIAGAALGLENGSNFIIDHCTFGWSGEENMTIYDNNLTTVQWCILHEGLYDAGHLKGARSYGSQWGGQTATYHHNLLAHNNSRTPRVNGAKNNDINVLMDYVNNVNYNWGKENSAYGGEMQDVAQSMKCNMINNYYKPGPARPGTSYSYFVQSIGSTTELKPEWHLSGNYMEGTANETNNIDNYIGLDVRVYTDKGVSKTDLISEKPFEVPYTLAIESAPDAFASVLAKAGAFPRDTVDVRIVDEVTNGIASGSGSYGANKGIIDDPEAVGGFHSYHTYNIAADLDKDGMADYWEVANGLDTTNADDRNKLAKEGYTYLEAYLNGLAGERLDQLLYPDPVYIDIPNEPVLALKTANTFNVYIDKTANTLHVKGSEKVRNVILFDLNGRKILSRSSHDISQVEINDLQPGLYVFRLETENGAFFSYKILK
jgi:pectate lyase